MSFYRRLVRTALFALPAETAHSIAHAVLSPSLLWERVGPGPVLDDRLATEMSGLPFASPIGLAPGFDKDCDLLGSLMHLGFGFLVAGSVLARRRAGNARPRLARLVGQEALLNSMGLPSKGLEHSVSRLSRLRRRRVPIFVAVQGTTPDEIASNFVALQPHVDAVELALVCPNTDDTSSNASLDAVARLAARIAACREKPVLAKVPVHIRYGEGRALEAFLDICIEAGLQGVAVCGARHVETDRLARGHGQLGGRPVFGDTLRLIQRVRAHAGERLAVVASGGVSTGRDAYEALRAGADLLEIYSSFIYRGWRAPRDIARELGDVLAAEGLPSVRALVSARERASVATA